MPDETTDAVESELVRRGYKAFHPQPLDDEVSELGYWTVSNKHGEVTQRDIDFLRLYVMSSLAAGEPFYSRGIPIHGHGYVRPDKAVMNSCINGKLVELQKGAFKITLSGLRKLGIAG